MEKLSLILWRERELLELLSFKLETEHLVLASGRTRWLAHANREVEEVLERIRETDLLRAVAADEAATSVGLDANPSLADLAVAAGEPWRTMLMDHRDAFVALTREIGEQAEVNRGLAATGYRSVRETLMSLGDSVDGYTPNGSAVVDSGRPRLIDRSL